MHTFNHYPFGKITPLMFGQHGDIQKRKKGPKPQIKAWVALVVIIVELWQIVLVFYHAPP